MRYVIFCQTPYNTVRYMTNDMQDYTSMSYDKFLRMLMTFPCRDYKDIRDHLDTFHSIVLNLDNGEYEQLKPEESKATFNDLLKLNPDANLVKEEEIKTDPILSKRTFVDNLFNWRKKNDNVNRYR